MYQKSALISPYVEVELRKLYWKNVKFLRHYRPQRAFLSKDTVNWNEVISYLKNNGVAKGSLLVVHSSYNSLKSSGYTPFEIISTLQDMLGSEGTLAMPVIRKYKEEPEVESSNGGSCTNCQPPTLGLNKGGDTSPDQVRVHGGFKCNGQSVDVQHYYTDFPLIENRVGEPLRCTFKVYEDTGADNVRHFEFAVGKRAGDSMSEEQGKIVWDRNHLLVATTTYDQNLFRDVYITTGLAKCRTDSANSECLQINLSATPKSPLVEDIIVKTNVWDQRRNAKTNFYNDGIDFVGNTENALPTYNVLDGRNGNVVLYTMDPTLENLDFAIDENGYNWYVNNNGFWQKEYIAPDTSCSVSTYIGYDRTCPEFAILKQGQILLAQEYFNSADIQSEIGESFAYEFPEQTDRLAGTQLG